MPNWGAILEEINQGARENAAQGKGPDLDGIRLKYIGRLRELTGRAVIVYASGFLSGKPGAIEGSDVHALMEVCHGVPDRELDLVIHSPGGSAEAAEQMVNYLRTQFDYIRAFVPLQAKSAATMMGLGCDEIVMGRHSELGPIDPQLMVPVPGGMRMAPAHAILRDFELAKAELATNLKALPAWTPILQAYAGGLLTFCEQAIELSQDVVTGWLERYMLAHLDAEVPAGERRSAARTIAEYFGSKTSYDRFRAHGRPIRIEELRGLRGLRVRALEDDNDIQDAVLSIYHALDFTFAGPVGKVVENHKGARYVRLIPQFSLQIAAPQPQPRPQRGQ